MVNLKINILIVVILILLIGCKDPEVEKKIDANLKAELIKLKKTAQLDKQITILFKVNEELSDLHQIMLKKNGVKITANIGDIYTGKIPAKSVYSFAKMRFIDYIQGQKKLKSHPADSTSVNF